MFWSAPFQFHKGAIRTAEEPEKTETQTDFNSIKVRLEHQTTEYRGNVDVFQFHKGAIRTSHK